MRVLSASVFERRFVIAKNSKKLIEIVASNRRKIIGTGLTLATIASFSPETIKSNDAVKQFTNKALLEYFFVSSRTENDIIYNAQNKVKENSLATLSLPLPKNLGDDFSSQENLQRAFLYDLDATPGIANNGIMDHKREIKGDDWIKQIIDSTENYKNWAHFEMIPKGNFELHVMDENLGGNPYPGVLKYLQITYDDPEQKDFNIELEQFSTMKFQKECQ